MGPGRCKKKYRMKARRGRQMNADNTIGCGQNTDAGRENENICYCATADECNKVTCTGEYFESGKKNPSFVI